MEDVFGKVDNLSMFVHPRFNEKFNFMDCKQSVNLAKTIFNKFQNSQLKNIVVIESGTSPLIAIIKKLKEYKYRDFNLIQLKIPRELNFDLLAWFSTYLSDKEKTDAVVFREKVMSRIDALKLICDEFSLEEFVGNNKFTIYDSINNNKKYNNKNKDFHDVLNGTDLFKTFNQKFLLFDEYINAGTIIRNFNGIVRLFSDNPKYKLSAFCIFIDNPEKYNNIEFTLYDNRSEIECYRNGAYPFENRIDLIGYYYFVNEYDFKKVYLKELKKDICLEKTLNTQEFYKKVNKIINENNLLKELVNVLKEEQVKKYVSNKDIIRFILKHLDEKIYGKNKYADFLDQVFELYAPSWSPMPVIYHLDYWSGFDNIVNKIDAICSKIEKMYRKYRFSIISQILESLEKNKKEWEKNIEKELNLL